MTEDRRLRVSASAAVASLLSVLIVGAGGTYWLTRDRHVPTRPSDGAATSEPQPANRSTGPSGGAVVSLTKDAVDRSGIVVTEVSMQPATNSLRVPGVVEPNAYRQVAVTPLVGGRVVGVSAQQGDHVRKGQRIAQVYSPELAEARTKYVAAKAMLEAHDRELQRTQKLVEIGAASRQELERIHAEHAAQTADVESTRSRLELLGAEPDTSSAGQASATTNVAAPIDGVVTERLANAGLNVDPATKLFTIVDLSTVWIVADVYERDLQRVHERTRATVTTTAFPDQPLEGRIGFIDPQLNAATRTAKIRVEVANPRGDLRPGMYADVVIDTTSAAPALAVPKDAVQNVGDRQVVYVSSSNDTMTYTEREVRLGSAVGEQVEVLSGLSAGERIVSKGSFSVRAEVERLGLRAPSAPQAVRIAVTEKGFEPDRVSLRAGAPARLTFVRTTDKTCGTEVVFPSLALKRALPLNEPVVIELTPGRTGEVAFTCGMNMLKGVVVVQ
jgi:membrane fusion protein, heavy metal efflux system